MVQDEPDGDSSEDNGTENNPPTEPGTKEKPFEGNSEEIAELISVLNDVVTKIDILTDKIDNEGSPLIDRGWIRILLWGIIIGIILISAIIIFTNNWEQIVSEDWTNVELFLLTISLIGLVIAINAFLFVIKNGPADPTKIIDELTDSVAIFAIVPIALWGNDPSQTVFLAIVSIALGKRVLKSRQRSQDREQERQTIPGDKRDQT